MTPQHVATGFDLKYNPYSYSEKEQIPQNSWLVSSNTELYESYLKGTSTKD